MTWLISSDLKTELDTLGVEKFLDSFGEERIREKEQRMQNLLKEAEPDEALHREIMLALGYKNNKTQFLELAMILPYSEIKKLNSQKAIENALRYRAGFSNDKEGLPANFDDSLRMNKSVWHYASTRPANFPEKRIKGISRLLAFSAEHNGLCSLFEKIIMDNCMDTPDKGRAIRFSDLIVEVFISTKTLGKMRALEICFNIILPFFIVYFQNKNENKYTDFIHKTYEIHPPLKDNSITRNVSRQLFRGNKDVISTVANSVKRYFGLIQFHNTTKV